MNKTEGWIMVIGYIVLFLLGGVAVMKAQVLHVCGGIIMMIISVFGIAQGVETIVRRRVDDQDRT